MNSLNMNFFKKCTMCGHEWKTREEFLADPEVSVIGYNVNFDNLELGFFLFNHEECGTTMAVEAGKFTDLYVGKIFKTRKFGTEECPGHCLYEDDLDPCQAECECAYVRDVLNQIAHWIKRR